MLAAAAAGVAAQHAVLPGAMMSPPDLQ